MQLERLEELRVAIDVEFGSLREKVTSIVQGEIWWHTGELISERVRRLVWWSVVEEIQRNF